MPHLNGYGHDGAASSLLEGEATAEAAGAVNRRTAVLFRKSKAASPHKPPREGDRATDGGTGGEKEGQDADEAQLASKSFLSVVIPRLETLLHKRKRKHNGGGGSEGEEEEGEEDEGPVKRLNTGEGSRARRTPGPFPFMFCAYSLFRVSSQACPADSWGGKRRKSFQIVPAEPDKLGSREDAAPPSPPSPPAAACREAPGTQTDVSCFWDSVWKRWSKLEDSGSD